MFSFALNGALTALKTVRLDIVGVITLGVITALGGGITRDILLGRLPPDALKHGWYLVVAVLGSLVVIFWSNHIVRYQRLLLLLDTVGLSLFCVTGTAIALNVGSTPSTAIALGTITAVGGGTYRDLFVGKVSPILVSGLYAVPALIGAAAYALLAGLGLKGLFPPLFGAGVCFLIRVLGIKYKLNVPGPIARKDHGHSDSPP